MLQLMRQMGERSPSGAFAAILRVLMPGEHVDLKSFKREYEANMQSWLDVSGDVTAPISEKTAARLIIANLALIRRYRLHLPSAVARFYRALLIADSVAIQLSPKINMAKEIHKIVSRLSLERSLRQLTPERYLQAFLGYQEMLLEIPLMFAEIAKSRALETALNAVRSLEAGFSAIGRQLKLATASVLRFGFRVFVILAAVVATSKLWSGSTNIPFISFLCAIPYPVISLLLTGAAALWLSRSLSASAR
jgi:predicted unusual protein kinase regulating ubiquinone biosynthesis (AarF/ABC1/UbiB family)